VGDKKAELSEYNAYPVAFLYRHALELGVKSLLAKYRDEDGQLVKDILDHSHKLGKHIDDLQYLRRRHPHAFEPDRAFDALIALLKEWDRNDPRGIMFRYGTKKDGETRVLPEGYELDIGHFATTMDEAIEYLLNVEQKIFDTKIAQITREAVGDEEYFGR